MKKKHYLLVLCFCFTATISTAQQSRIFLLLHTGSYMDKIHDGAEFVINAGFGYERDFDDKISISLAYRRLFYLQGIEQIPYKQFNINSNYYGTEQDTYTGHAIDYESKYFFDSANEGWYFSSGISFQMMRAHVQVLEINVPYGTSGTSPVLVETFDKSFNLFPLTFKIGRRYSGTSTNFDLFLGYSVNLGASQDLQLKYSEYIRYDKPSTNTLIFGCNMAVRF